MHRLTSYESKSLSHVFETFFCDNRSTEQYFSKLHLKSYKHGGGGVFFHPPSMYQAQRLLPNKVRPVILHGYGGAKRDIPRDLPTIAHEGWLPLASAMVGRVTHTAQWVGSDLRPVLGTCLDLAICPDPLTEREELLFFAIQQ